jgi:uncharacterized membrane protein YfcA
LVANRQAALIALGQHRSSDARFVRVSCYTRHLGTFVYSGLVLFLAYFVRGMAGFGSGLIAVPLLSLVSPVTAVVPLVVSLDYLGSASQGIKNLGRIAWKEQLALVPFMLVGVGLGLYVLEFISTAELARGLGAFVIVYAVYQVLPLPPLRGSRIFAITCGLLGGLVGTLFGSGGPFYVIYLNLRDLEKRTFRATFAFNFLIDGGIRLIAFVVLGLFGWETLVSTAGALPIVAAGLFLGGHVHTRFSQRTFVWLITVLLIGTGVGLLLKG